MISLFATKPISGNPYDAMDTTFISIFSHFKKGEVIYYTEAPLNFPETGVFKKINLKFKNKFLRILKKVFLMRRLKPDYVFGCASILDLPFILLKPRRTKYLMNFHSILVRRGTPDWPVRTPWFLRKFLFEKADIVVAISESARKTIIDCFPQKRVELIYSGVDLDFFVPEKRDLNYLKKKFNIRFDKPLVVYVASLHPRKRPDVFIEIARRYLGAEFLMIGKSDGVHDFLSAAQGLKNFRYIERMEREEIAKLFSSASVFLFPSLQEPFGLVVVEAMACGLPVIVSASGAFPELVKDDEDGFLIPVGGREIDNFTEAIGKILSDKKLWQKFSTNAINNVKRFSWENTAKGYKKILLS